jgi:transposase
MGRRLQVEWTESATELKRLYRQEKHAQRRTRLHALWLLREGQKLGQVAALLGVHYRTLQEWMAWYRQGGLQAVLGRVRGHHARGKPPYLNAVQQRALVARVALGGFRTVWEVRQWVRDRWGIAYSYDGMHNLMQQHQLRLKVPRPQAEKASPAAQEAWKKGG